MMKEMKLLATLKRRKAFTDNLSFEDACFLSWLSYFNYGDNVKTSFVPLKEMRKVPSSFFKDASFPSTAKKVFKKMGKSEQFSSLAIGEYRNFLDPDWQYASCLVKVNTDFYFFTVRGTDPSVSGWKENFLTGLREPIKAQRYALKNLRELLQKYPDATFSLGGHSKGGSILLYAYLALDEEEKKRIRNVFLLDSPALSFPMEESQEDKEKIIKRIPETSFFGMMFEEHPEEAQVVLCKANYFLQHNVFLWECDKEGKNILLSERDQKSKWLSYAFNHWVNSIEKKDIVFFINTCFEKILRHSGLDNFFSLIHPIRIFRIYFSYRKLPRQDRTRVKKIAKGFLFYYREAKKIPNLS